MHSIYKYPLNIIDEQSFVLPKDNQILSVINQIIAKPPPQESGSQLVLYAMVPTNNDGVVKDEKGEDQVISIRIIGTGNPIDLDSLDGYTFINTVQQHSMMWHVYYKKII